VGGCVQERVYNEFKNAGDGEGGFVLLHQNSSGGVTLGGTWIRRTLDVSVVQVVGGYVITRLQQFGKCRDGRGGFGLIPGNSNVWGERRWGGTPSSKVRCEWSDWARWVWKNAFTAI
jgi:hypothetical protein